MNTQRKRKIARGTATVELALILGFLLLLILGGLSFALQFHARHCMVGASRAAARELAIRGSTWEIAQLAARDHLSSINADFTLSREETATDITVQVSVLRRQVSLNVFPAILPVRVDERLTAQTTMRKEYE